MRAARVLQLTGLAVTALALDLTVVTPRRLRVHDVPLAVPGWPAELDGLRVAVVGDVHCGSPWFGLERVRSVVQRVADARPDLVLLLGDYMVDVTFGVHHEPGQVADALSGLKDVAPVVGVLGNHDWDADGVRVREAFEAAGLPLLEESAVPVLDGRLWIAGVGDLWRRTPSVPKALASVPADATVVLLTHNPDVVLKVPRASRWSWPATRTEGRSACSAGRCTGSARRPATASRTAGTPRSGCSSPPASAPRSGRSATSCRRSLCSS